jgi:hypothetical protein
MLRFVILEHDSPQRHWDLLIEAGDVLRAWRLLAEPKQGVTVPAEPSFDHRKVYLDYEGPISGDRGSVTRWDVGVMSWRESQGERLCMELVGRRLQGVAVLQRTAEGWRFFVP